jgi:hypothetical protein
VSPPKTDVASQVPSFEPVFHIIAGIGDESTQARHLVAAAQGS